MNKPQQFNSINSFYNNYLPNQLKCNNLSLRHNNQFKNSNLSYYSEEQLQKMKEVQQIKKVNFKNEIEYFDNKLIIEKQNLILDKINNLEEEIISLHLKIDNFKKKKKEKLVLNEELELIENSL